MILIEKKAGSFFGEVSLIATATYSEYFYVTDIVSHLCLLNSYDFQQCIANYPILRTLYVIGRNFKRLSIHAQQNQYKLNTSSTYKRASTARSMLMAKDQLKVLEIMYQ